MGELYKTLTDNIFSKLTKKVYGKVTVYVDDYNTLVIRVLNGSYKFEKRIDKIYDFLHKNDLSSDIIVDEFLNEFKLKLIKDTMQTYFR